MKFSEKINIISQLSGMTQEKLAQRLDVSFATLNSWVNERSQPRTGAQKRIDQLYQELTGLQVIFSDPLEAKKKIFLEKSKKHKSILRFIFENPDIRDHLSLSLTYNTNRIEGSTLSESETAAVMFDNVALPNKTLVEQLEVKNHQAALNYLLSYLTQKAGGNQPNQRQGRVEGEAPLASPMEGALPAPVIDEMLVLKLHAMLMNGIREDAGCYRRHAVRIVGANIPTANYVKIPVLMKELIEKVERKEEDIIRQIALVHSHFEKIHPFSDGNGRIGRLMIQAMSLRRNGPPAIIQQKKKRKYHAVLNIAQRTDETRELEEFLCDAFLVGFRLLERK